MTDSKSGEFIYRIIRFEHLVSMLKTNEWHFSHPSSWEDPYENRIKNPLTPFVFGQCWCRNGVSDAMWRIYSPAKIGVRIRVRTARLKEGLLAASKSGEFGFRLEQVKYINELEYSARTAKTLVALASRITFTRATNHLFLKRPAFEHEAETRVHVFDLSKSAKDDAKHFKVQLNSRDLIESVLVDPRAPDEYVEAYAHYLNSRLNFHKSVKKSQLYRSDEKREG